MNRIFSLIAIIIVLIINTCCTGNKNDKGGQGKIRTIDRPNVIFILADDLGYGDVHVLNKNSSIPTPNMDRLAIEGVSFIDAHSGSAVCTPTRYGVLTGRYAWRSKLKRGVLNGYSGHLIDFERKTIADVFKNAGYSTACIGKWHLGMDMPFVEGDGTKLKIDTERTIRNGPNEYGFDYFYGISASLDFPPYAFIENNRFVADMDDMMPKGIFPKYFRAGEKDSDFNLDECLDQITTKAIKFIQRNNEKPFFLYFPLTAPHKPVWPHKRFRGSTNLGPYGDFVAQVDWTVGEILNTLDDLGIAENTMVVLTSDNGSFMKRIGDHNHLLGSAGHVMDSTKQAFDPKNHTPNFDFRGTKADIYEGGHRVPFFVSWPKVIVSGKESQTICLTDFFATSADILNIDLNKEFEGEDSFSFLSLLTKTEGYQREPVIHHSANGTFAIRKKDWKLVFSSGSGGRQQPLGKPFVGPYQLYNLSNDGLESINLADESPAVLKELRIDFEQIYSRTEIFPGAYSRF